VGDKFEPLGKGVAAALGIPDLRYVTTPHPINRFTDEEIAELAAERYADVVRALTGSELA
jgi:hypothetical protein